MKDAEFSGVVGLDAGSVPPSEVSRAAVPHKIGHYLRFLRETQDLTQQQIADCTRGEPWELSRSAISAIERGRSLPSLEALIGLAHVLHIEPAEIIERVERLLQAPAGAPNQTVQERMARGDELFWAGSYREALALFDGVIAMLPPVETGETADLRATCQIRRATVLRRSGMLLGARAAAEEVIAMSDRRPARQAEGYVLLASCYRQFGNTPLALDASQRAIDVAQQVGEPRLLARAWLQRGACLFQADAFEPARQAFLRARAAAHRGGDHHHLPHVVGNVAMCWKQLGEPRRARRWLNQAVLLARRHEVPALEASWLVEIGALELEAGEPERADRLARAALTLARPLEHWLTIFRAEWLRHRVVRHRAATACDRHRVAYLKKLLRRLGRHQGDPTIQQFKREILHQREPARESPS